MGKFRKKAASHGRRMHTQTSYAQEVTIKFLTFLLQQKLIETKMHFHWVSQKNTALVHKRKLCCAKVYGK